MFLPAWNAVELTLSPQPRGLILKRDWTWIIWLIKFFELIQRNFRLLHTSVYIMIFWDHGKLLMKCHTSRCVRIGDTYSEAVPIMLFDMNFSFLFPHIYSFIFQADVLISRSCCQDISNLTLQSPFKNDFMLPGQLVVHEHCDTWYAQIHILNHNVHWEHNFTNWSN